MEKLKNKQIIVSENFNFNNKKLINLADPENDDDASNKSYIDGIISTETSQRISGDTSLESAINSKEGYITKGNLKTTTGIEYIGLTNERLIGEGDLEINVIVPLILTGNTNINLISGYNTSSSINSSSIAGLTNNKGNGYLGTYTSINLINATTGVLGIQGIIDTGTTYAGLFDGRVSVSTKLNVGVGSMINTYQSKTLNVLFTNTNTGITSNVGELISDGLLIRNYNNTDDTFANLDFVSNTASPSGYNSARICFKGSSIESETTNYLSFILHNGIFHQEQFRMTRSGVLHVENDIVSYSTSISSDIRLKKDIEYINDDTLSSILKLKPAKFNWIGKQNNKKTVGFIAQDVEDIFPDLICEIEKLNDDTGILYKHLRYTEFIPYIVHSIQIQQKIINEQQIEIEKLKEIITKNNK